MFRALKKFFEFSGPVNKKKFYGAIILGVIKTMVEVTKVAAIGILLHQMLNDGITTAGIWASFLIIVVGIILQTLISNKTTMLQTEGGYETCANKRIEIAEHMRYLPMGYFNANSLGNITSVATNTMEGLADIATRVVMMCTQGMITTGVITAFIIVYDYRVGLATVIGVLLFYIVNMMLQKSSKSIAAEKNEVDTNLVGQVIEYVQNITEVKNYNLAGIRAKKLNTAIEKSAKTNIKSELSFLPFITLQNAISKLTGVAICMLSVWFYINGTMHIEKTMLLMLCSFMIYSGLEVAGVYSSLLRTVSMGVDKANAILETPTMDIEGEDITPANHDIDLKNVVFSYDQKRVIDGISIHIPDKSTTAIVGPSGGGKTTLCHLISRFWDVESGQVLLGGVYVKKYSMDSLMKNFSFVFQNVYLFNDTIANNIRFGAPDTPMDKVIEAAKKACCHDFIMQLPDGYETIIGEGGASLSGGEKQRISIARAILKDAPIIILDEATANVDPENEKDLVSAIDELTKEKTIIMIAHRLKTVRNADNILVIEKGKIVQQGNHNELMKQEGIYKRFIDMRERAVSWKLAR